jgi:hypothetical protein
MVAITALAPLEPDQAWATTLHDASIESLSIGAWTHDNVAFSTSHLDSCFESASGSSDGGNPGQP